MARLRDIEACLAEAEEQFAVIRAAYDEGLLAQHLPSRLPVKIKNYFENLRSALDYVASDIWEIVLGATKPKRTYFPINTSSQADFDARMRTDFPGLDSKAAPLRAVLESAQGYNATGCRSFAKLSKLVNDNKHDRLSPQTRTETKALEIRFPGGAGISMSGGASISGHGTISSGGAWIAPAGGVISADRPARIGGGPVTQHVTVWVSFCFSDTGDDVLGLLSACRADVQRIIDELSPQLWKR